MAVQRMSSQTAVVSKASVSRRPEGRYSIRTRRGRSIILLLALLISLKPNNAERLSRLSDPEARHLPDSALKVHLF